MTSSEYYQASARISQVTGEPFNIKLMSNPINFKESIPENNNIKTELNNIFIYNKQVYPDNLEINNFDIPKNSPIFNVDKREQIDSIIHLIENYKCREQRTIYEYSQIFLKLGPLFFDIYDEALKEFSDINANLKNYPIIIKNIDTIRRLQYSDLTERNNINKMKKNLTI